MTVTRTTRARFGGHVTISSYGNGSPVYVEQMDTIKGTRILHEFHPSNAREIGEKLIAAANDAEGIKAS